MSCVGNAVPLLKSWRKRQVLLLFLILFVYLTGSSDFFKGKCQLKVQLCSSCLPISQFSSLVNPKVKENRNSNLKRTSLFPNCKGVDKQLQTPEQPGYLGNGWSLTFSNGLRYLIHPTVLSSHWGSKLVWRENFLATYFFQM